MVRASPRTAEATGLSGVAQDAGASDATDQNTRRTLQRAAGLPAPRKLGAERDLVPDGVSE